jgi:hypothetical protein
MSQPRKLPPDPDELNDKRAEWAGEAVQQFMRVTKVEQADVLSDLLADLMHWADHNDQYFEIALRKARRHYTEETDDAN